MKAIKSTTETSQAPTVGQEHDLTLIRQVVADAERFQNDPDRFAELLAADAHLVNVVGYRVTGRDEIHRIMSEAVKTALSEISTRHELHTIRFLKEDVALVACTKYISSGKGNEETRAVLTFVMTKQNGNWLISSAQNTLVQEAAIKNIREKNIRSAGKHLESLK
jgi:uncharacterized protein (TIGR02246 family)